MRPRGPDARHMALLVLKRSRRLTLAGSKQRLDLSQPSVGELGVQPDRIDHPMQVVGHARRELGVLMEHCRNGLYGTALVESQHEELLAYHLLEGCKSEAAS